MPKGIPKKKNVVDRLEIDPLASPLVATVFEDVKKQLNQQPAPLPKVKALDPLGPGQAYFEAPDGTIVVGEDTKDSVWYRALNKGKGGWINRKR
jgi:hypothetical protein